MVVLRNLADKTYHARVVPDFESVLALPEKPAITTVDMPIGLLATSTAGGRPCEASARALLGPRAASVFSSPARPALEAWRAGSDYAAASLANRGPSAEDPGISQQAFGILPKIAQVDALLDPSMQSRVLEVHPELSFMEANRQRPMAHGKKSAEGQQEREAVLVALGFSTPLSLLGTPRPKGVKSDDLLDACIACWTAERAQAGNAIPVPVQAPTDARGLQMQLWR